MANLTSNTAFNTCLSVLMKKRRQDEMKGGRVSGVDQLHSEPLMSCPILFAIMGWELVGYSSSVCTFQRRNSRISYIYLVCEQGQFTNLKKNLFFTFLTYLHINQISLQAQNMPSVPHYVCFHLTDWCCKGNQAHTHSHSEMFALQFWQEKSTVKST